MSEAGAVLTCRGLKKSFSEGRGAELKVLLGLDLAVSQGESVAIVGASGSGKSTFLHLLGGLDKPTRGEVLVQGENMARLGDAKRGALRNRALGFIYQFHHLLPEFTAVENVAMPLIARRDPIGASLAQARELLGRVGLEQRLAHKPSELSGGERQRAAVARALVTHPACVLADEPTGNLDGASAQRVWELMMELNRELGTALVVATHDIGLARRMDRVWTLNQGRLEEGSISGF
jgi:lipoprotein-releasing system ATP-binding protein